MWITKTNRNLTELNMFFKKTNKIDEPLARLMGEGKTGGNVNKQSMSERIYV